MSLLKVEHIAKTVSPDFSLVDISFNIEKLNKVAIIGASGGGKTTLLKIVAGLLQASSGNAFIDNEKILGPNEQLLPGHKSIGYLSQHYELHNNYVVKDLLWFDNKLTNEQAAELFKICDIEHLLNRKTNELSGGEKQRISLCKQIIKSPKLLVLDEPFSNLDVIHKNTIKKIIDKISSTFEITVLLASHEPQDVLSWANEIIVLQNGNVVQHDTTLNVYNKPKNEYVAALLGVYNIFNGKEFEHSKALTINQKLFIRPENVFESTLEETLFFGKIKSIQFLGAYHLVEVVVENSIVYFTTTKHDYVVDANIGLSLDKSKLHVLSLAE